MIVALSGRRIDAEDAEVSRFPLQNVSVVERRLTELLRARGAQVLVSAAACGADLIAQQAARTLALRRVIILPFPERVFRDTSVIDRPGDWGPAFDSLVSAARSGDGEVVELAGDMEATQESYQAANLVILDRALAIAAEDDEQVLAVVVWEGQSRGADDVTADFANAARARGIEVTTVLTVV